MRGATPDITIHLGDVYYSGTEQEYRDYFLAQGQWPLGSLHTYALNGNHEMYSGGEGYFGSALPQLGQQTSYFCLESSDWRVVAVDTGYYARTFPGLELVLNWLIRLPEENCRWLREVVFADGNDDRPVILLSHHQWFSAFEGEHHRVGRQLDPFLEKVALWLWGHEHRFAAYAPCAIGHAPPIQARCIGHGGMPVEISQTLKRRDRNLVCWDARQAASINGEPVGWCGYALLDLDGPTLSVRYIDQKGVNLMEERWKRQPGLAPVGVAITASNRLTRAPRHRLEELIGR